MAAPVDLGTLLFTAVEPHRGHEFDYNRWYETDHFYAGCLAGPHCFAGGRFVAPKRLKDLRSPATSPMCADPLGGSLLAIYCHRTHVFASRSHPHGNVRTPNRPPTRHPD